LTHIRTAVMLDFVITVQQAMHQQRLVCSWAAAAHQHRSTPDQHQHQARHTLMHYCPHRLPLLWGAGPMALMLWLDGMMMMMMMHRLPQHHWLLASAP
jgi:hypothetical protein